MSIKTTTLKKYGFFAALTMVVGSVVGIGIFVKNGTIFNIAEGNSIAVLIAWIIGGLVSLLSALSFSEVYKDDGARSTGGLSGLAEKYVGEKFGRFVRYAYSFFYFPILLSVFPLFIYIFLSFFIGGGMEVTMVGALVSMVVGSVALVAVSTLLPKVSSGIMQVTLIVKAIPLIVGALAGLFFTKNGGGIGNTVGGGVESTKNVMALALAAMPGVLFAFDAFANVGTIIPKTKNASKTVPLAILAGMIFVAALYLLITISQINHNSGTVWGLIGSVFNSSSDVITTLIFFTIVLSATGTANAITTGGIMIMESMYKEKMLPNSANYVETELPIKGGLTLGILSVIFAFLFFSLKLLIKDSSGAGDGLIDALSNMPTLFFFPIYAIIFIGLMKTKIKNKKKDLSSIYFYVIATISSLGIFVIVGYQFYNMFSDFGNWSENYVSHTALIIGFIMFFTTPSIVLFFRNLNFLDGQDNKIKKALITAIKLEMV